MALRLEGSLVALVTPFVNDKVDAAKIRELVDWQIKNGTTGIVACGTTAEAPTLTEAEQDLIVETILDAAKGRVPVIVGTGSNNTRHVVERTQRAAKLGAQGALVVSPYYNKPTQEGLFQHFREVAKNTDLPIVVYNIQGRTGVNIETKTLARLAEACKNIVAVKEASGNLTQMSEVAVALGPNFAMLCGDDALTLPCMSVGGKGVISTIANIVPRQMADLARAALEGDYARALTLHQTLLPMAKVCFVETNPGPIKEAMAMAGMIQPELRLPMVRPDIGNKEKLREVLQSFKLV
jgi:4-hydroxy-tetrahydrodipicolinate synthase